MNRFQCFGIFFILLLLSSCFERSYSKKEMWDKAISADPELQLILPDENYPAIDTAYYGPGCMYGIYARVKGIVMLFVRYENEDYARKAAVRFKTHYKYNWIFEDIQNEPILQDFVEKVYGAKRPKAKVIVPEVKEKTEKEKEYTIIEDDE